MVRARRSAGLRRPASSGLPGEGVTEPKTGSAPGLVDGVTPRVFVMRNVARIIEMNGGLGSLGPRPVRVGPPCPGLMRLCVEHVGSGPRGLPLVSVAHYFGQNGDLMADPNLVFEVTPDEGGPHSRDTGEWEPVSFTQHATGTYQEAVSLRGGEAKVDARLVDSLKSFARVWDRNIGSQGYVAAFARQRRS